MEDWAGTGLQGASTAPLRQWRGPILGHEQWRTSHAPQHGGPCLAHSQKAQCPFRGITISLHHAGQANVIFQPSSELTGQEDGSHDSAHKECSILAALQPISMTWLDDWLQHSCECSAYGQRSVRALHTTSWHAPLYVRLIYTPSTYPPRHCICV